MWAGEGILVCIGDWLVAIMFCDDMLVVSSTHAGLQTLLDKAGEVYDLTRMGSPYGSWPSGLLGNLLGYP